MISSDKIVDPRLRLIEPQFLDLYHRLEKELRSIGYYANELHCVRNRLFYEQKIGGCVYSSQVTIVCLPENVQEINGAEITWRFEYDLHDDELLKRVLEPLQCERDDPHCGSWYSLERRWNALTIEGLWKQLVIYDIECRTAVDKFRERLR